MTRDEFDLWFDEHSAYFPGIRTWLGKLDQHARAVTTVWFESLKRYELVDALAASQRMYDQGRSAVYEKHVQVIRAILREIEHERTVEAIKPRFVDGQQVYQCPRCEDDGRLIAYQQRTLKAAREGTLDEPGAVVTCAVACQCSAGDHRARDLARYDPRRWLLEGTYPTREAERQAITEFVASMPVKQEAAF